MTARTATASWSPPKPGGPRGLWWDGALSAALGAGFTLALFLAISWYETVKPASAPPALADLGVVMMPLTPPPPPTTTPTDAVAEDVPMIGFDLSPSNSSVKVAASPPTLDLIPPQELSRVPVANLELHLPPSFRPHAMLRPDTQHIYQRFEVDTLPTVLVENSPQVSRRMMDGDDIRHVTLIWVIEADGTVTNIKVAQPSGSPRFDQAMVDMIRESIFSPAMKGGRKVRMMTQQLITAKWSEGSPFH